MGIQPSISVSTSVLLILASLSLLVQVQAAAVPSSSPENVDHLKQLFTKYSTSYAKYDQVTADLQQLQEEFPTIVQVYSIGRSVQGRELNVVHLRADNVLQERPLLMPMAKIVSSMHGNEVLGRSLVLMLIVRLLQANMDPKTEMDHRMQQLLATTDLHLMPVLNPDGFEVAKEGSCEPEPAEGHGGRRNAKNVDLNRDFPDQFSTAGAGNVRAPETEAAMKWIRANPFVLSANLHAGALVASYPFDSGSFSSHKNIVTGKDSLSPDNGFFKQLARSYADSHPFMPVKKDPCGGFDEFDRGITNGAHWYSVAGGMQDFNYMQSNCFELTIELSCCKYPKANTLAGEWKSNEEPLIQFLEAVHFGVKGIVTDLNGKPVDGARIVVQEIGHDVYTTERGEYWRLLVDGDYHIGAAGEGDIDFKPITIKNGGGALIQNFTIEKPLPRAGPGQLERRQSTETTSSSPGSPMSAGGQASDADRVRLSFIGMCSLILCLSSKFCC